MTEVERLIVAIRDADHRANCERFAAIEAEQRKQWAALKKHRNAARQTDREAERMKERLDLMLLGQSYVSGLPLAATSRVSAGTEAVCV